MQEAQGICYHVSLVEHQISQFILDMSLIWAAIIATEVSKLQLLPV
jgi:hypothetical protein